MRRDRCGFDLDGVLAETGKAVFYEGQRRELIAPHHIWSEVKTYNIEESFPGEITYEDITAIFRTTDFWKGISPCPYLVDGAREAARLGAEIHIVTARTPDYFTDDIEVTTREWLEFQGVPFDKLVFAHASKKKSYCVEHNLDFFIEDRLDTATGIARSRSCLSYLVATPYNRMLHPEPGLMRELPPYFENIYSKHYIL